MRRARSTLSPPVDVRDAAVAGVAGAVAYVAEMELDLALIDHNAHDLVFLGGPFVGRRHGWAKPVGLAVHAANGVNLGLAYAMLGERHLPGPPWWRGVVFANVENAVLYPLTVLTDRYHTAIRDGRLDRYWRWPAFVQSVLRHVAYGAVLGIAYDRLRRRRGHCSLTTRNRRCVTPGDSITPTGSNSNGAAVS